MTTPTPTGNDQAQTGGIVLELERLRSDLAEVRSDLAETRERLAATERRYAYSQSELAVARQDYSEFGEKVRDTAIRYAARHGWCETVDQALVEIGLEPRTRQYRVTVTVTGEITRDIEATDSADAERLALDAVCLESGETYSLHSEDFRITEVDTDAEEAD